ncbi:glycosyltransferase family 4 protein [Heliophilum fasciatum]|uniref:Galacturonosyltransferase n=1 Tax=Heliophilum fasciatum TaxID=35700 RepID=A0A4R2RYU8_9FIRM|nr:glycosyltransferase family 4 protein [Heliophilum fasciatum]MCW2277104.1 galacturonosyltransferase [Heliophilum fasciatum]TCP68259.1 galacturonosyltransferase [Heliophilum fasciatum]
MAIIMMISPKDNNFYNFRRELIEKLIKNKYEVYLVCPYGKKMDCFIEMGCKFINLTIDRRGTNPLKDLQQIRFYVDILKKYKPDLVLTYTTKCSIYGGIACGLTKTKYIVNNAGLIDTSTYPWWLKFILDTLYRLGFRKASCMMYQNSQERDYMNRILRNKVNYHDIPGSGVNVAEFSYQQYPEDDSSITFNFVARIVKIKGIDEFLECAKRIHSEYSNTRFIIYGDYDDDKYKVKLDEYIKCGYIEYGGVLLDMKSAIASAHAVIHPSYYEGMTNVVLEHSAMGRVCIGSDIPGVNDAIENGVTGYTFPRKDVGALVETVRTFIELPHERKETMGRTAREKVEREFDRSIVTNVYLEEIEKVLMED